MIGHPLTSRFTPELLGIASLAAAFVGFAVKWLLWAWVADDAYISFRVVDNLVNGYGLRWNTYERVQTYTNPLWVLLHAAVYLFWDNIFYVTLSLCFLCSSLALIVPVLTTRPFSAWAAACFWVVPLTASHAWMSYSSSGLENPLSFLLFAAFGWACCRSEHPKQWLWLSVFAGLAVVNRADTVLIYAPPLLYFFYRDWRRMPWLQLLPASGIVLGWFAFSLLYYGFIFPNTKYAKLNAGQDFAQYVELGLYYIYDFLNRDSVGAATMLIATVTAVTGIYLKQPFAWLRFSIFIGVLTYCVYIVLVGGDFMSGRFFTLPVFISAWLIYQAFAKDTQIIHHLAYLVFIALVYFSFLEPKLAIKANKVFDEQPLWHKASGLYDRKNRRFRTEPEYSWVTFGKSLKRKPAPYLLEKQIPGIGYVGYYAGPQVTILDMYALSDALLARIPVKPRKRFRIGHIYRPIPEGYREAIKAGNTETMHPDIAVYYTALRTIISDDIWDVDRLKTLYRFHRGEFEPYRQAYLQSHSQ